MPKVSVVIPAYNCEKFISTAIESVLGQTYKDYEIIVVNDGSTDRTDEVVSRYIPKVKKISQPNKGIAEARNTGVFNAEGEYVAFLDGDDAWLPDKLQMQVNFLEKNDRVGLVYADTFIVDNRIFAAPERSFRRAFQTRPPRRGSVFEFLFMDNFIATSSVVVRKECLSRAGRFDPSVVPIEDYDIWLRIAAKYEVDYIDIPLVKYRDHISSFRRNKIVTVTHIIDVLNRILSDYPFLRDRLGEKADRRLSYYYITLGKTYLSKVLFREALHNFYTACKLNRSPFLPFSIIFSSIFEGIVNILRFVKSKIIHLF